MWYQSALTQNHTSAPNRGAFSLHPEVRMVWNLARTYIPTDLPVAQQTARRLNSHAGKLRRYRVEVKDNKVRLEWCVLP